MTKYDDTLQFPGATVAAMDADTPMGQRFGFSVTADTGDNEDARSLLIAIREALPDGDTLLTTWDGEVPVLLLGPVLELAGV